MISTQHIDMKMSGSVLNVCFCSVATNTPITRSALILLAILAVGQFLGLAQWGKGLQFQIEQVNGNVNTALVRLKRLEAK
jgi:hypothetical protein